MKGVVYWTSHRILHLFLLLVAFTRVQLSSRTCPRVCECHTNNLQKFGDTYFVNCFERRFTEVPNFSSLINYTKPIRIDLTSNRLQSISQADFPCCINVVILLLGRNARLKINDGAFTNIKHSLTYLSLRAVNLNFVSPLTFLHGLSNLVQLGLSNNEQGSNIVISDLFRGQNLNSVRSLSLRDCGLTKLEDGLFQELINLMELDLSSNFFTILPNTVRTLKNLTTLSLASNGIKVHERNSFLGMSSISHLVLSGNEGLVLEQGTLSGLEESLKTLELEDCQLVDIPTSGISTLKALKSLILNRNPLTSISNWSLIGTYCLKVLELRETHARLTKAFLAPQVDCLREIYLDKTGLYDVPSEALSSLKYLELISMKNNGISILKSGSIRGFERNRIDLDNNPISIVESEAFSDILRIDLSLQLTNISDLSFLLEYGDYAFYSVWLHDTHIPCDCPVYIASRKFQLEGVCFTQFKPLDLKSFATKKIPERCSVQPVKQRFLQPNFVREPADIPLYFGGKRPNEWQDSLRCAAVDVTPCTYSVFFGLFVLFY